MQSCPLALRSRSEVAARSSPNPDRPSPASVEAVAETCRAWGSACPQGFSVANSPITSSGTLNVTYSGGIPNSAFANSTITLGNTTLTLGGTTTNLSGVDVQTNTGKFLISGKRPASAID